MLAVLRAQQLMQNMKDSLLDKVYTNNLPIEEVDDTTRSVALITDVRSDLALPGNDDFHAQNKEIEVQIYYKLDGDDPDEFETRLKHLFINNGWVMTDNRGHTVDPETQQLTVTFYFTYFEIEN
ncbi:DUF806 family protein [Limosilactobacillus albertensis]|uniref:DUF806 family protein n=1 Tax=Limosilactobacillus albertensis TaxID=2759752 RepID=A0A839H7T8_9LACO|nr:DUF806 family protein [Limosilactobacillus albertensis]MBB1123276.1 DUF806 family protein [Limosilactobacillus albertensis]MCD7121312.1 DUF806 family protein [Limosilactobacillus albertensis]